jgi:adenylate kinase
VGLKLVLFGRQGAGKGTQSTELSKHYGASHVSTGDMLREAVAEGTSFGQQAKEYMDSGALLPDEIMLGIIKERFAQSDVHANGFLLDGFPRTLGQAEGLLGITEVDLAVNLEVPKDVVLDRLSSRRVCVNCNTIYSTSEPPSQPWTCDVCGGEVVQRADDQPEAIAKRLEAYERDTVPAIERFGELGLLETIDGLGRPDEVTARLIAAIDAHLSRPAGPA